MKTRDILILDDVTAETTPEHRTQAKAWFDKLVAEGTLKPSLDPITPRRVRAGYDFPCALHRGPAGDCNEHNCRCA